LPATRAALDAAHPFETRELSSWSPGEKGTLLLHERSLSGGAAFKPRSRLADRKNEREQVMRRFAEGRIQILAGVQILVGVQILAGVIAASLARDLAAHAQDSPLPPNTLPCDAFTKKSDGTWFATRPVTFDVGNAKNLNLDGGAITPKSQNFGGVDLYVLLDAKCGKTPA
jgi:hypothetical protein